MKLHKRRLKLSSTKHPGISTGLYLISATKYIRKKCILKNISLSLYPGRPTAIIGENGSGKTTLANLLSGYWHTTQGERKFNGIQPCKVSYLFQSTFLDQHLSIENCLEIIALMKGLKKQGYILDMMKKIAYIFDVQLNKKSKIKSLSEGQKRMLEFCIATDPACDLLLLDEPTTHLDVNAKDCAIAWLHEILNQFNGIAIICTHDADEFSLCSDFVFLSRNSIQKHDNIKKRSYKEIFSLCKAELVK